MESLPSFYEDLLISDTESEAKVRLYRQNAELVQKNKHLMEQNQILQRQFESACEATNEFQTISDRNTELEKKTNLLIGQNEDLNQRIEILVQSNSEITKRMNEMQIGSKSIQITEIANLQKKYENEKIEFSKKEKELNKKISKLSEVNENQSASIQKLNSCLTKIYEAAKQKFSIELSDPETLISLLLTDFDIKGRKLEIDKVCSMTQTNEDNCNSFIDIHKVYKSKNKKLKKMIETLKNNQNSSINELKKNYEKQILDLTSKSEFLNIEIKKHTERIERLVEEKKELIQENGKLTAQIEFSVNNNNFTMNNILNKQNISESNNANNMIINDSMNETNQLSLMNDKLKNQISLLISKIKLIEDDRNRLKFLAKTQKKNIIELNADIQHISSDKKEMTENIASLENQVTNLVQKHRTAALTAQQQTEFLGQRTAELEKMKIALSKDQNVLSQQLNEIQILQEERNKLVTLLKKHNLMLEHLEKNNICSSYTNNCFDQTKNNSSNNQPNLGNLGSNENEKNSSISMLEKINLPFNFFECNEYPDDLRELVSSLAMKNNLRAAAKIKQIILVIVQYFNEQILEIQRNTKDEREKYLKNNELYKSFSDFIRQFFVQIDPDLDINLIIDNLSDNICHNNFNKNLQILEQIEKFKQKLTASKNNVKNIPSSSKKVEIEENNLNTNNANMLNLTEIRDLYKMLNCNSLYDCIKTINSMQDKLVKISAKFKKEKTCRKRLYKESIQRQNRLVEELENTKIQLSESENSCSSIEVQNENEKTKLSEQIEKYKNENMKMKEEILHFESIKKMFTAEMNDRKAKIQNLEASLLNKHKELKNAYRSSELLQQQNRKKELEVQELRSTIKLLSKQYSERLTIEKELFQQRFDQIVEPLKIKNCEFQMAVNDLNDTISALESDNMKLRNQINDISLENEKIVMNINSLKSETEREKQLIESKSKAMQMASEVDCQAKVEEWKWKLDQAKKNVMSLVGLQFCSLFNVTEKLDENNFESFLNGLRSLLEKLTNEDNNLRVLLALGPTQSIENAVSKLLLETKK